VKRKAVEGVRVIDTGSGRLAVIYCDIGELTPNPKNPRVHSPRQVKQLARSIKTFGFCHPDPD
jgi:ParB-like nuclease family protein